LRVHERGVGETRACGSGASAAVAVGRRRGWLASAVDVELPGGRLTVEWQGPAEPLWLTGEAVRVFEGRLVR
jgi:diaminopimelate epimerase